MFDYITLRIIWWAILGALLISFAVMDGFDLIMTCGLPAGSCKDRKRRKTTQ